MASQKPVTTRMEFVGEFSKGSRLFFLVTGLSAVLYTCLGMLTPQVIRVTVDSVIDDKPFNLPRFLLNYVERLGGREFFQENLAVIAGLLMAIALLSGIFNFLGRYCISKGSEGFTKNLRDTLFDHIQRLPFQWHVQHQTGDIVQRCTADVDLIRQFLIGMVMDVVRTVFLVGISLVLMFSMNVKLSLIALAFLPFTLASSGVFYRMISGRFRQADEAEGLLTAMVQENLTGVRVVRAFGRERYEIDRFNKQNNHFSDLWIRLGYVMGTYWGIGDLVTGLQIAAIVTFGAIEAVNGNLTLGQFLAFASYNSSLVWPIRGLGRILSEMSKSGVSMDRLLYVLQAEEEEDRPGAQTPQMNRDIAFKNVTYAYEEGKEILRDINLHIPAGSTLGILGGTGSGKSTLVHLLTRLYDLPEGSEGSITVGGVDLRDIRRDWVRKNTGIVLQEPFLFSRTIRENISIFRPDATLEEVRHAASIACVDDAIMEFGDQYDTVVGERGVTLSGGQKQRVAIARMLMQQAPIMIFDDSLSAVDSETDAKIRAELRTGTGDATVILISHRINTLMQADQILVLDEGRIAQLGTHEELTRQAGIYKDIYDIQLSSDDRLLTEGGDS